jgi:hypothetical protein
MDNTQQLINKVEQSGLVTLDLAAFLPSEPIAVFDLKDHLVQGLVLMEKPFREALTKTDWTIYQGKAVGITCSTDALIPLWAYMLVSTYLQPFAINIFHGNNDEVESQLLVRAIENINVDEYKDGRIVIKGCGDKAIPPAAFIAITRILKPVVKSLMYGEPCSTVPIYKSTSIKNREV